MEYKKLSSLPSPLELKKRLAINPHDTAFINKSRSTARNIFFKKESKIAVIMGPCSIHDEKSCIEYALKFKELSDKVSDKILLIMRAYFAKPRSQLGWKGFMYDPNLNNSNQIKKGITSTRRLLVKLTQMRIPVACEFLDIYSSSYYEDLISWGFIGARTSSSQPHRELASSFSFPIGFKNNIDGDVSTAIDAIHSSNHSHNYITVDDEGQIASIKTYGNPFSHLVLRGSNNNINYDEQSIEQVKDLLNQKKISSSILVDCSHGNAKSFDDQKKCFHDVLVQSLHNNSIIGLMLESNLNEGSQPLQKPDNLKYGVSITDPCLNWEESEKLILDGYDILSSASRCAV